MPKKYTVKNRKHGGESKLYQYLKKVPETMTKYRCKNISSTLNRFKEKEVCPETIKEFVNSYLSKYSTIEDMIIENSYKLDVHKINKGLIQKAVKEWRESQELRGSQPNHVIHYSATDYPIDPLYYRVNTNK
jgi:hypothetical protein